MLDAGRHPRIKVLASSELKSVSGYIGNFTAVVRRKARFVSSVCTSCGDCLDVCPVSVPDEFEEGLGVRTEIDVFLAEDGPKVFSRVQRDLVRI